MGNFVTGWGKKVALIVAMKNFNCLLLGIALCGAMLPLAAQAAPKPSKPTKTPKKPNPAAAKVPAIFYDTEWVYGTATLYDKTKNIVSSVSGEAQFERNGKFRQDYYIGSIGNFYKGTYKFVGNRLVTTGEDGKKIFDFGYAVSTTPPVLVLSLFNEDGSKSVDFSLFPKKKKQ